MSFTLPDLPYPYDALAPYMSRETLEYHHDKHHLAYVNNGNNLLKGTEWEGKSLEDIVKGSFGKNAGLFNNAGQHYNHLHFWKWMKPNGGGDKIPGNLEKKIIADLGSVAKMKEDFIQAGVTQFGSGWCWLAVKDGKIAVTKTRERRKPAGARRQADPRLRRVGAFLLHRLSQPPAGLPQGVRRSSGQLGIRRQDVRRGDEVTRARLGRVPHDRRAWRTAPLAGRSPYSAWNLQQATPQSPTGSPSRCCAIVGVVALLDLPRLRARLGRLRPCRIRRAAARRSTPRAFADRRALSWVNLYYYGGGFDLVAALLAKVLPFTLFETRRLVGALVGLLGLFVTWRIGRRIGGPLAGLLALVLLATCPLYYGHMFMNAKDSPFAVAMAIFLLGLVRAFEEYPRPSVATVRARRHRLRPGVRLAHHGRVRRDLLRSRRLCLIVAVEARADGRRGRPAHGSGASCWRSCPPCCSAMRSWRWSGPGPWSIRSIRSARSNISRTSSRSRGRSCSAAA